MPARFVVFGFDGMRHSILPCIPRDGRAGSCLCQAVSLFEGHSTESASPSAQVVCFRSWDTGDAESSSSSVPDRSSLAISYLFRVAGKLGHAFGRSCVLSYSLQTLAGRKLRKNGASTSRRCTLLAVNMCGDCLLACCLLLQVPKIRRALRGLRGESAWRQQQRGTKAMAKGRSS